MSDLPPELEKMIQVSLNDAWLPAHGWAQFGLSYDDLMGLVETGIVQEGECFGLTMYRPWDGWNGGNRK